MRAIVSITLSEPAPAACPRLAQYDAQIGTPPDLPPPGRALVPVGCGRGPLPDTINAGLEIDVMRTAQLAGILVFDIGRPLERVGRAAHPTPGGRGLSFRDSHVDSPQRRRVRA